MEPSATSALSVIQCLLPKWRVPKVVTDCLDLQRREGMVNVA
jgi:hypothetical protein